MGQSMTVELRAPPVPRSAGLEIDVRLRAQVHVSAFTAQRKVSKLMLDRVSNLLCGHKPALVVADRIRWRVPVWLGFPTTGLVSKVGEGEGDVETGEILFDQHLLDEIAERADALARRTLPTTYLPNIWGERGACGHSEHPPVERRPEPVEG